MTALQYMRMRPGGSFLLFVILMMALSVMAPRCARAQTWRGYSVTVRAPDCRLAARSSEDFITDGANQVYARRWQLEAIRVGGAFAVSEIIHRIFLPHHKTAAAVIGGVGVGLLPHVRSQLIQRRYPIDLTHDAAQAAQSMVPFLVTEGEHARTWSGRLDAAIATTAVLLGTACWAQY